MVKDRLGLSVDLGPTGPTRPHTGPKAGLDPLSMLITPQGVLRGPWAPEPGPPPGVRGAALQEDCFLPRIPLLCVLILHRS